MEKGSKSKRQEIAKQEQAPIEFQVATLLHLVSDHPKAGQMYKAKTVNYIKARMLPLDEALPKQASRTPGERLEAAIATALSLMNKDVKVY